MTRRCRGCGRPLRRPSLDGYGPVCRARLTPAAPTPTRRTSARHTPTQPPAQPTLEDTMTDTTDEMPDTWVRALADTIEAGGWTVADAHESAIVIDLTPAAMRALDADPGEQLIIGWSEAGGTDWGLGRVDHVPTPQPLGGHTVGEIAARVDRLLRHGRPEPRELRHAIPYADPSGSCSCPVQPVCGGIVPDAGCPDHGDRQAPAMAWHWEAACPPAAAARPDTTGA